MTWENILKADFSFRDIIKNSRGVYAGIFDRIQLTPDLSKLGGAVLGDAVKAVENIEGMTVTDKRKTAEVVLMEPILIGLDMMNDPSMEKELDDLMEMRVSSINDDKDNKDMSAESLTDNQMQTIDKLANNAAQKVFDEMKKSIDETLNKRLGEVLSGPEKQEVRDGVFGVISSQEFVGYTAVVLNALILKVVKESNEKASESDNEVEVNPDQAFSEDFMEANKMDWFSQVKR